VPTYGSDAQPCCARSDKPMLTLQLWRCASHQAWSLRHAEGTTAHPTSRHQSRLDGGPFDDAIALKAAVMEMVDAWLTGRTDTRSTLFDDA
jgi:hypothetical protein